MNKMMDPQTKTRYDFRTDVLDIIIGGKSSIDSIHVFQIQNLEEADRFVQSYGYNFENPIEQAEILGNFHEALNFIRKHFLQPENPKGIRLEIPRKIIELSDLRELFLMASLKYPNQNSDSSGLALKSWACSVLRVMHTIAHIDKDVRTSYFPDIQKQIFDRFYKFIQRDEEGRLYLGESPQDPMRVHLVAFETKPKKSRNSIILKLLHKPENVAEDIFDRVGIRFVTHSRLGALQVVKYLKDKMIIMPPNIKPSRSRNTLIQLDDFRSQLSDIIGRAERGEVTSEELETLMEHAARSPSINPDNPHTSEFYRAIQFTCRQLIKLQNPMYDDLKDLRALARSKPIEDDLARAIEKIDLKHLQREIRFFYPYEVQVVDQDSAEENEKGKSAHSEYKRSQLQTALKRVMGTLAHGI